MLDNGCTDMQKNGIRDKSRKDSSSSIPKEKADSQDRDIAGTGESKQ